MPVFAKKIGFKEKMKMPEIITEADLQQAQNLISPKNKADIGLLKKIITERPKNAGADISDIAIKIAMIDITNSTHLSVQRNKVSLCELAEIIKGIQDMCGWIAEITVYPGEKEQAALAAAVFEALEGKRTIHHYSGKPVWTGFDGLDL